MGNSIKAGFDQESEEKKAYWIVNLFYGFKLSAIQPINVIVYKTKSGWCSI